MKSSAFFALLSLASVSVSSIPLSAQTAPVAEEAADVVDVSGVKFSGVRYNGEPWLEAAVALDVKPKGRSAAGQFVDRVRVTLNLGFDATDEKGAKRKVYFRSSAEAVTLEGGGRSVFRFYLPSEVIERYKLRGEAQHHAVEIEIGGRALPPVSANFSSDIKTPEILKSFLSAVGAEATANDGVLLPQYLSPFAYDSQRRAPAFIRRENQR